MNGITAAQAGTVPDLWVMMLKSLGGLCIVLGVLMGVLYLLKMLTQQKGRPREGEMIRLLSSFYLAPKERILLMEVLGRKILIGVTAQGITRITEFENTGLEAQNPAYDQPAASGDSFFKNLMSRIARETSTPEPSETTAP